MRNAPAIPRDGEEADERRRYTKLHDDTVGGEKDVEKARWKEAQVITLPRKDYQNGRR